MGFSAVNPVSDDVVTTPPFMPNLSVRDFSEAMKLDGTVTPARMAYALKDAALSVCRELKSWVSFVIDSDGFLTLAEYDVAYRTDKSFSFKKAVYNTAKAQLTEHYRDYDTGRDASARSKELTPTIDSCYRNARNAIADITDEPHSTIELI